MLEYYGLLIEKGNKNAQKDQIRILLLTDTFNHYDDEIWRIVPILLLSQMGK